MIMSALTARPGPSLGFGAWPGENRTSTPSVAADEPLPGSCVHRDVTHLSLRSISIDLKHLLAGPQYSTIFG